MLARPGLPPPGFQSWAGDIGQPLLPQGSPANSGAYRSAHEGSTGDGDGGDGGRTPSLPARPLGDTDARLIADSLGSLKDAVRDLGTKLDESINSLGDRVDRSLSAMQVAIINMDARLTRVENMSQANAGQMTQLLQTVTDHSDRLVECQETTGQMSSETGAMRSQVNAALGLYQSAFTRYDQQLDTLQQLLTSGGVAAQPRAAAPPDRRAPVQSTPAGPDPRATQYDSQLWGC